MRKRLLIVCLCLSALSMMAQTNEPSSAAGYDFYFTLFDHWGWSGNSDANNAPVKYCGFTVCATEAGDMTLSVPTKTGDKILHFDAYNYLAASLKNVSSAVLQGVHFHSTAACFLHVWAHGSTSGAETMILPKHLLGTEYMLQGVSGGLIESEGTMVPTYSQFAVVGTENGTNVVVTPKVQLRCVSCENAIIPAGRSSGLYIQENKVLLFQPDDYTKDVSGTLIESDKVVAVFQGNNLTRIPYGENWSDYTWEQALPTDTWGKEFIVPKSHRAPYCLCQITALYDNTTVYYYINGNKQFLRTLSAGETLKRTSNLPVEHFVSDQPICCYLYNEGAAVNDGVGDPTMVAIVPMDNMATETRWMLEQVEDNSPYKFSLLVTTRLEDESKVKYNNTPLSSYQPDGNSVYRTVTDGFVTYEMGISAYMASKLIAEDGAGFSAYILRIGNTAEASAFNISMPFKMPPPDFCPDGALLFKEDFGGNDPSDPVVSHRPVSGMSSKFTQIYDTATCKGYGTGCVGMGSGRYLVTKRGFRNSSNPTYSVWHIMDDHTSFGDTTTGYFLEIDGRETDKDPFFSTTMDGLCSGMELSFSTYVANVTTAGQYNAWRTGRGYVHPQLTFLISDPMTGAEIARYNTDTISHDWSLFGVPNAWKQTANWQQVGMKFTVPDGISRVKLTIQNNAYGSTGNDFALDDIEVRLCMPPVSITAPDTVCWGDTVQLQAEQAYPYMIYEPLFYLWEFSSDSITWTTVQNSMSDVLNLNRFQETNAGWYRVSMGTEDRVGSENCRSNSEPVRVEVKLCLPPVTIQAPDTVCVDTKNIFTALFENGGVMDEPLQYFWEFSSDSITWTPMQEGNEQQLKLKAKPRHTGWYRVTVYPNGGTPEDYCHMTSEPFRFYVIEDCPPILCPEGKLLTTSDGLCANMDLSFIVNLLPNHAPTRLLLHLIDADTEAEVRIYDTGDVPSDSIQVGTSLTVPEGVSSLKWTIQDNSGAGSGDPLPIDNIELRLCIEPITIEADTPVCRKYPVTLRAVYDNYDILQNPQYQWEYSSDSIAWTVLQTGFEKTYTIDTVHRAHEGWYVVQVADSGNIDQTNCRSESEPFRLNTIYCNTSTDRFIDTVACDTLLPLAWRGHSWPETGTRIDTIRDIDVDDSIYVHLHLDTVTCCPEIVHVRVDSAVCDTLMPFLWFYQDTMVLFNDIGAQEIEYTHHTWFKCVGEIHTLVLDTFHCERLYPIIVNKYNWQLLLDHVSLRHFFPGYTPLRYQWYCDSVAIPGATEDDYAEQNELHGHFQLYVELDQGEHAWSNVIDLSDTPAPKPVTHRIYNAQGLPVSDDQLAHGVYLIVYQQGDRIWTEKRFVP